MEIPMCIQTREEENISGKLSYCTFARIGHIIAMRQMAIAKEGIGCKWAEETITSLLTDGDAFEADGVQCMLYVRAEFTSNNPNYHDHNNERR